MQVEEKLYQVALSQVRGVGYVLAQKLMARFGSAQAIFQSMPRELTQVPGVSQCIAQTIRSGDAYAQATEFLALHEKANIRILTPWEEAYPERLRHIDGTPTLLYLRGDVDLNAAKVLSIVGTRNATNYGKKVVETLLGELSAHTLLIVSGLAYGVDIHAHKTALAVGLPTLAVVAGGVDTVYPSAHKRVAEEMLARGGLLAEHPLRTKLAAHQFAARNRIIAGMADATIVVEAGKRSGALITAQYANAYNREVFAVSGSIYEPYSVGCHHLIKTHQAHLLTSAADIAYAMHWDEERPISKSILDVLDRISELTEVERSVAQVIGKLQGEVHIDQLSHQTQIPLNQLSAVLLQLELKKIVKFLPGRKFRLIAR
ncbi:MAG: DNA-processing protein DprA [Amoebophilaceae bacterium]|jgi:DNA processing protein|nr:DNA-processing protein DprA [Amoebophilaceae bacterium]